MKRRFEVLGGFVAAAIATASYISPAVRGSIIVADHSDGLVGSSATSGPVDGDSSTPAGATFVVVNQTNAAQQVGNSATSGSTSRSLIFPFLMPALTPGQTVDNAVFQFTTTATAKAGYTNNNGIGLDVYALTGYANAGSGSAAVSGAMQFQGVLGNAQVQPAPNDATNVFVPTNAAGPLTTSSPTPIQNNITTSGTVANSTTYFTSAASASPLTQYLDSIYAQNGGASFWAYLRVSTDGFSAGNNNFQINMSEATTASLRPQLTYNTVSTGDYISLVTAPSTTTNPAPSAATLAVSGSDGSYVPASVALTNSNMGVVNITGFSPSGDGPILIALDVEGYADQTALDNFISGLQADSGSQSFTATDISGNVPAWVQSAPQFGGDPNDWQILLSFPASTSPYTFSWNFANTPGIVVDRIAVVPEPAVIALLSTVVCGCLLGRWRRRAAV